MNVIPFSFESFSVCVVQDETSGEPWFVAADVARALSFSHTPHLLRLIDDDEKGVRIVDTLGGAQEVAVINESGLFSAILKSRKPEAKRFKKWVTGEVLPSIRKTGGYALDPMQALNDPTMLRGLLANYSEKVLTLEQKVSEQAPKVEALDRLATASDGSFCVRDAAKNLQVREKALVSALLARKWVYRRPMGSGLLAYSDKLQQGVLEHKVTTGERGDGSTWTGTQVRVTAKGMTKLAEVFRVPCAA